MNQPADLNRYAKLIESMLTDAPPFVPTAENAIRIQVERGLRGPVIDLPSDREITIVDSVGHTRPVYRPLLVYSWLLNVDVKSCKPDLCRWIKSLPDGIWAALVHTAASARFDDTGWASPANEMFRKLIDQQQPSGAFFPIDLKVNPETRWYDELITLHALTSYSVFANDAQIDIALKKAAIYHLEETQPDHASAQPWGLLAFIRYAPPLADQILHAMLLQYPAGISGVPLLLLADVLYGLRAMTTDNGPLTNE